MPTALRKGPGVPGRAAARSPHDPLFRTGSRAWSLRLLLRATGVAGAGW
jgi:hypothetical protein